MKAKAVVLLFAMAMAIASCSGPQTEATTTDTTVVFDTVGVAIDSAVVEEVKAEN